MTTLQTLPNGVLLLRRDASGERACAVVAGVGCFVYGLFHDGSAFLGNEGLSMLAAGVLLCLGSLLISSFEVCVDSHARLVTWTREQYGLELTRVVDFSEIRGLSIVSNYDSESKKLMCGIVLLSPVGDIPLSSDALEVPVAEEIAAQVRKIIDLPDAQADDPQQRIAHLARIGCSVAAVEAARREFNFSAEEARHYVYVECLQEQTTI